MHVRISYFVPAVECSCRQLCIASLVYQQVYLLTLMDRAMLHHAKSPIPYCMPREITRQQRCERYLKHIATQTVTCRLLAYTSTIRPTWSICCQRIIQASLQQIHEKLNRWSLSLIVYCIDIDSAVRERNSRPMTTTLLGPFHGAIAVPSVTRCRCCCCRRRCRGHRCARGVRQCWRATVATPGE